MAWDCPVVTFLGLTPVGWAFAGTATVGTGLLTLLTRRTMRVINEERAKGGLDSISAFGIVKEVKQFEVDAKMKILRQIAREDPSVKLSKCETHVEFGETAYLVKRLIYLIEEDGVEWIVFVTSLGRRKKVYCVKTAE